MGTSVFVAFGLGFFAATGTVMAIGGMSSAVAALAGRSGSQNVPDARRPGLSVLPPQILAL